MLSTSNNKIREEPLHSLSKESTFKLDKILEETIFAMPINLLKNFYLLRINAINNKLTSNYIHLLDKEPLDEN